MRLALGSTGPFSAPPGPGPGPVTPPAHPPRVFRTLNPKPKGFTTRGDASAFAAYVGTVAGLGIINGSNITSGPFYTVSTPYFVTNLASVQLAVATAVVAPPVTVAVSVQFPSLAISQVGAFAPCSSMSPRASRRRPPPIALFPGSYHRAVLRQDLQRRFLRGVRRHDQDHRTSGGVSRPLRRCSFVGHGFGRRSL